MDYIFIKDLQVETVIGVYPWEREIHQVLALDIEMQWDTRAAAQDDDLSLTVDYEAVVKRLTELIEHGRFQLVETVAERCAEVLLHEFNVYKVRLRVAKPTAIKTAKEVGVAIERQRAMDA